MPFITNTKIHNAKIFRNHLFVSTFCFPLIVAFVAFFNGKEFLAVLGVYWPFLIFTFGNSLLANAFPKTSFVIQFILGLVIFFSIGIFNSSPKDFGLMLLTYGYVFTVTYSSWATLYKTKNNSETIYENSVQLESQEYTKYHTLKRRQRRRESIRARLTTRLKSPRFRG